jgi:transposase-like protein
MTVESTNGKKASRMKEFPNQNKSWSSGEDLKLLDLYKTKKYEEIGKILGRTTSSCASRIYALNNNTAKNLADNVANNKKMWAWEDDQLILELEHRGRSTASIARQIKRTEISVSGRLATLKRLGKRYNPAATKPASLIPIDEFIATHPDFGQRGNPADIQGKKRKRRTFVSKEKKIEIVRRYRTEDLSLRALAGEYGVNFQAISNWNAEYKDLPPADVQPTAAPAAEVKEEIKVDVKVDKVEAQSQNDLQKIIDQFKGVKGTTILVIHQS